MGVRIEHGDCIEVMARLAADGVQVDSVVTDPPYHLTSIVKRFGGKNAAAAQHGTDGAFSRASKGFMGQTWDGGDIAFRPETWAAVFAVMKPGAHLLAFNHSRTWHRMAAAIEDAGFEIRDTIMWLYGSGMPKSHNLHGDWEGWGSALKPAFEPIVLARKPLAGTIAGNMAAHRVGALNIDGCRVGTDDVLREGAGKLPMRHDPAVPRSRAGEASCQRRYTERGGTNFAMTPGPRGGGENGRWPANVIHDGSDEVVSAFPDAPGQLASVGPQHGAKSSVHVYGDFGPREHFSPRDDAGTAARFFYSTKADADDRCGSKHPTVKPIDLMAYLCRLVTPPGGLVLDPFAGSGTTGMACLREGLDALLIEREAEYVADIRRRVAHVSGADTPLFGGAA